MTKEILSYFNFHIIPFSKEVKIEKMIKLPSIDNHLKSLTQLAEIKGQFFPENQEQVKVVLSGY